MVLIVVSFLPCPAQIVVCVVSGLTRMHLKVHPSGSATAVLLTGSLTGLL